MLPPLELLIEQDTPMNRAIRFTLFIITASLCLSGCGLLVSGTWEDDPGNWLRAFQTTMPDNVVVIHSYYWRSTHWSYEFQYFFALEPNAELTEQIISQNRLVKLDDSDAAWALHDRLNEQPAWFAPKAPDAYTIWTDTDQTVSHFKLIIDKATGVLFLTDYRL